MADRARERYLPAAVLQAMQTSSDPSMQLLAARYLPAEGDRQEWEVGDIARGADRSLYAYCGGGRWREVVTGVELGRDEVGESLELLVRGGFPICSQHPLGELLTLAGREPPVGSVVVTSTGHAMVRLYAGWTDYDSASEPESWDWMLSYERVVRLVHWDSNNDPARGRQLIDALDEEV